MSALIVPGDGQAEQVARDLLSLARTPHDVQTNTDSGLAFVVPDYLAEEYAAAMADLSPAEPTPAPAPTNRRRGRTRKDNN